ncbi:retrovirus-related pol polyprotein from transposon TNT 1-94 [Tanacetum coccineum]|uniref:Retrovirus-related pol polyprotein from transposon TNT 1-94 n=1 Tax=Tanacetum coccineum TaxID=301880 RepID=A0ABQ5EF99_9ASTR
MCTYLKNIAGWKPKDLKTKSFANVQELFDKAMKMVNTFVNMDTEFVGGSEVRAEGIPDDGDDVTIGATPLSVKILIVDYKIYQEGKKSFFKIIRADGKTQMYLTFTKMHKNFDREDLEVLWRIVKARFKKTEPVNYMDTFLHLNLKTMFEHHVEDSIWKNQQGLVKVLNWKLFDSCGVHCVTVQTIPYYLLVEKMYPLTKHTLHQMFNNVKLQVDYESEMAYELLRLVKKQLKEGYVRIVRIKRLLNVVEVTAAGYDFYCWTMLADSKLSITFWAEAVNTASYVQNKVSVIKPHNKTPYEFFLGRKPALSFMRPFGCPVTILNTIDHPDKFDGKADEGFFVRYSTNSKAFRVFNSRTRIVEENLHIQFSENTPNIARSGPKWLFDIDALTKSMNYKPIVVGNQSNGNAGTKECADVGKARVETLFGKDYILLPLWTQDPPFSSSPKDSPNAGFKQSGEEEKKDAEDSGKDNDDEDVGCRARHNIIDAFLPEQKKDERGIVIKNIARLVAQGYTQEKGVDYDEVFAPVARIEAIRIFLAYASFKDFVVYQDGCNIYKVEKALYGLHQAPRACYETLSTYLLDNGFSDRINEVKTGKLQELMLLGHYLAKLARAKVSIDWAKFWSTAKTKTVNNETQIHAKVEGKTIVISESSVRRDLQFDDEDGTVTPLFSSMLAQQADMGEGSGQPNDPQHTSTSAQPFNEEPITVPSSSQPKKTHT